MKEVLEENKRLKALEKKTMEEYQMSVMMGEMDLEPQTETEHEQQHPLETLQIRGSEGNDYLESLQLMDIDRNEQEKQESVQTMDIDNSD